MRLVQLLLSLLLTIPPLSSRAEPRYQLGANSGVFVDQQNAAAYVGLSLQGSVSEQVAIVIRTMWHAGGTVRDADPPTNLQVEHFLQADILGRAYLGRSGLRLFWEAGYGPNIVKLKEEVTTNVVTGVGEVGVTSNLTLVDGMTFGTGLQTPLSEGLILEGGVSYTLSKKELGLDTSGLRVGLSVLYKIGGDGR